VDAPKYLKELIGGKRSNIPDANANEMREGGGRTFSRKNYCAGETDLRQLETDFMTSPTHMRRMPERKPNSHKKPSDCKYHSTHLVTGVKETRSGGGHGFSGGCEAGLEMKRWRVNAKKL
jgi:hypothetical protein